MRLHSMPFSYQTMSCQASYVLLLRIPKIGTYVALSLNPYYLQ